MTSAYRLRRDEPLADGIRRAARGRVQSALGQLRGRTKSSPGEAVHEARKDMKKLRALLRLARAELGEDLFRIENAAARDTARLLAGARDAAVMLETLDGLPGRYPALRRALEEREAGAEAATEAAIASLREMRKRVSLWPLERDGFGPVERGLRRVYRQGRRAMRRAEAKPSDENLHEWRKREKDLWYQLRLLRDAWPSPMRAAAAEADALSELLGEDHDLAVLVAFARERGEADELEPVVARRRAPGGGVRDRPPPVRGAAPRVRRADADLVGGGRRRSRPQPAIAFAPALAEPAIKIAGLRKSYDHEAVRGVDFEIQVGEVFGFLGPNGEVKEVLPDRPSPSRSGRVSAVASGDARTKSARALRDQGRVVAPGWRPAR